MAVAQRGGLARGSGRTRWPSGLLVGLDVITLLIALTESLMEACLEGRLGLVGREHAEYTVMHERLLLAILGSVLGSFLLFVRIIAKLGGKFDGQSAFEMGFIRLSCKRRGPAGAGRRHDGKGSHRSESRALQ